MIARIAVLILAFLDGAWMVYDGVHVMVSGVYSGPSKPGPWSDVVSAVGIDPLSLGPVFVILGLIWLVSLAGLLFRQGWGRWLAGIAAVATLWYLPVGTVFSVIVLILLAAFRRAFAKSISSN
jgi:hypothetical protein